MSHSEKTSSVAHKSAKKSQAGSRTMPYLSDIKLLPRMRKFLDNKSSADNVDVNSFVTYLQKTYPEYRRKKRTNFSHSVSRALDILTEELHVTSSDEGDVDILSAKQPKRQKCRHDDKDSEEAANDSDQSFSDDAEYAEYQDSNGVNTLVTGLYTNSTSILAPQLQATQSISRKTGFVRCQSDPIMNTDLQLSDLGYIDRRPSTPVNHSKVVESLPASPSSAHQQVKSSSTDGASVVSSKRVPLVITIGDDEEIRSLESTQTKALSTRATPKPTQKSHGEKLSPKRKTSANKGKDGNSAHATASKIKSAATAATPKKKGAIDAVFSTTKFSQIGGNEKSIEELQKLILHMRYPEIYQQIGVTPPRGFLLHGPPGCGKTLMAHAIAGELELPFFKLAATELVSGVSGESEERVRNLFHQAAAHAPCILFIDEVDSITPKRETASKDMERRIVSQFLTCLDDLCEKKESQVLVIGATNRPDSLDPALRRAGRFDREISMGIPDSKARESILQVLCKDIRLVENFDYSAIAHLTPGYVGADLSSLVQEAAMLAVNEVFTLLEKTIKAAGCMQQEQHQLSTPNSEVDGEHLDSLGESKSDRVDMPMKLNTTTDPQHSVETSNIPQPSESSTATTAGSTTEPATAISHQSATMSTEESAGINWKNLPKVPPEMLNTLHIGMEHFMKAVKIVQPSAKREGFVTVPGVTWQDIGALKSIREELQIAILAPVKYPEQFKSLGLTSPSGVLLAGPPGCGKTLLAKAIANESGINFISVKGPELINMYVGESEKAVRQVFQRARNSSPCVVFFDELDSLCPRRSLSGADGGSGSRIVNQLLTEMDGLEERKQVFVMGATNRPDIIDPAVLRPGRLDKTLYVGLPSLEDRVDILKTITRDCTRPVIEGVQLAEIASLPQCEGFSGADLTALVREASMAAMKEYITKSIEESQLSDTPFSSQKIILNRDHFQTALTNIKPSISPKDRAYYTAMACG